MSSWPEVPIPGGDLSAMRDAQADLLRRSQLVHADAVELDRIAEQISRDWLGRTAETFTVRVGAARTAIDCVSDTHLRAAQLIGSYKHECDYATLRHRATSEGPAQDVVTYALAHPETGRFLVVRCIAFDEPFKDYMVEDLDLAAGDLAWDEA